MYYVLTTRSNESQATFSEGFADRDAARSAMVRMVLADDERPLETWQGESFSEGDFDSLRESRDPENLVAWEEGDDSVMYDSSDLLHEILEGEEIYREPKKVQLAFAEQVGADDAHATELIAPAVVQQAYEKDTLVASVKDAAVAAVNSGYIVYSRGNDEAEFNEVVKSLDEARSLIEGYWTNLDTSADGIDADDVEEALQQLAEQF